eukprot:TRINITY_DN350_c0_g1_i1.p1 TRINITY_DN350_c0_g1~~TRINITY_DN350_c0_g1_i1.p1  ORF type:complete len:1155 (+),score=182.31 TRINITY_DN350_c0_g1_i1:8400-11864(+)
MSASTIPPNARSNERPPSSSQPSAQPIKPEHDSHQPPRLAQFVTSRKPPTTSHAARGESISLARRAAAVAKKKRERARAQFEQQGLGTSLDTVLREFVSANASTRPNVSQNKAKRQKRIKWTQQEVEALRLGVQKYGEGRWAVILRENANMFNPVRISVDLKDKWRNLSKTNKTSDKPRTRPAASDARQSVPITNANPLVPTSAVHPEPPLPIVLRSTAGLSIGQTARVSEKPSFPTLPAMQVHPPQPPRSLLNPKPLAPDIVPPLADVRRTHNLQQTHHSENLPVFTYPQTNRSHPFQCPSDPVRSSALSGFRLHPSPGTHKTHDVESRPTSMPLRMEYRSLPTPSNVSLLVGNAPHDSVLRRSLEERTLPHGHHTFGNRADHRTPEVMHHTRPLQPLPTSHSPHSPQFDTVSPAYASSTLHVARERPSVIPATQSLYGVNRDERLQPVRILGASISQGQCDRRQPVAQHVVTNSNHFRPIQTSKGSNIYEQANESYTVPGSDVPVQNLGSRFTRLGGREPRAEGQRDVHLPKLNRQAFEGVVQHHKAEASHPEQLEHRNLRGGEVGSRGHPRNNIGQSLDDDMQNLRSSNPETRFTHPQTEDDQDHYLRASGNDAQFGPREGGADTHQRQNSPQSSSRFSQDDEDMNRNSLDPGGETIHMGVVDQQSALVQTGECIHNEDSMHHVEVPREVLDNDDDEADDEHISHPHTDPNEADLYHGNDDDQLPSHHPFSVVNPEVEHSADDEPRDENHTLALSHTQQGMDLQVRLDEESQDCYVPERARSPSSDQERQHQGQNYSGFTRDEKIKSNQLGDVMESDRRGHLLIQRRDRDPSNGSLRTKSEINHPNNLRFSENQSPENSTERGAFCGRDDEGLHPDRQVITGLYDKDSDQLDSNTRGVAGEIGEFPASGMHSNESELTRKGDFKVENEEHRGEVLETKDTRGMLENNAFVNCRDGGRRGSALPRASNSALRLRNSNEEDPVLELHNGSSCDGQNEHVNTSSSDSSREIISLVDRANTFKVKRIKASAQRLEMVINSHGAAERELQASLRSGHGVPIGCDKGLMQNKESEMRQGGDEDNSMAGEERHRVEAVASVANLLNPTSFDSGSHNKGYNPRKDGVGKGMRSHGLPGQDEAPSRDDLSVKRPNTVLRQ